MSIHNQTIIINLLILLIQIQLQNFLQNKAICELDPNPIIGRIKFNLAYIKTDQDHISFQDNLAIILHEITHILGFSSGAIQYWINPDTNQFYDISKIFVYDSVKKSYMLKTKNVAKVAQFYFNCSSINGMFMENQGGQGTMGSHWERDLTPYEYMIGYGVQYIHAISIFTSALLKDTGYYADINYNLANEMISNKDQGCDFIQNTCSSNIKYEFGTTSDLNKQQCVQYGIGGGQYYTADGLSQCINSTLYVNGFCENTLNTSSNDKQYRQSFGPGLKCFNSNILENGFSSDLKNFRCLKFNCSQDFKTIDVYFWENEFVTCKTPLEIIDVKYHSSSSYGPLECPRDFKQFCTYPKFCKNFCSSNGKCQNGICICLDGFAGEDCSIQCDSSNVYDGISCIQKCSTYTFKNPDNTCKVTCPYGYYKDSSINECIICHSNCSSCTGPTTNECQSCNIGYTLSSNSCIDSCHLSCKTCNGYGPNNCLSCPDSQYLDSKNSCQSCFSNCKTCTNSSSCSECQPMYLLNQIQNKCDSQCDITCKTCSKPKSSTSCLSCDNGYYLDGNVCKECVKPCKNCLSEKECLSCQSEKDYSYNSTYKTCDYICDFYCLTCKKPNDENACSTCYSGFYLLNNTCLECDYPCYTCQNSASSCRSCYYGYEYQYLTNTCSPICHKSCLTCIEPSDSSACTSCSDGFFLSKNSSCLSCSSPCKTCLGSSISCQSCIDNYQYFDSTKSCSPICHKSCLTCSQPNDSSACISCPNGFFLSSKSSCLACSSPCQSCSGSSTLCQSCINTTDYKYDDSTHSCQLICHNSCISCTKSNDETACIVCADGYYFENSTCKACISPCKYCSSVHQCKNCISETDYIYNETTQTCQNVCHASCKTCNIPNNDKGCSDCIDGKYLFNNQCLVCQQPCLTCRDSFTKCTKCISGYKYDSINYTCSPICHYSCLQCSKPYDSTYCNLCADGFYLSVTTCLPCDSPCNTCSDSATQCKSCISPTDYEYDSSINQCKLICHKSCITCFRPNDQDSCNQCADDHYLEGTTCKKCVSACQCNSENECQRCIKPEFFYNQETGNCQYICHSSCKTCSQPNNENACLDCNDGYFLNEFKCQRCDPYCKNCKDNANKCTECDERLVLNPFTNRCNMICDSSCNTCSRSYSESSCISCRVGHYLHLGKDDKIYCNMCKSNCQKCQDENICNLCKENYQLDKIRECKPICDESCETCSSPFDKKGCLTCKPNKILKDQQCLNICHKTCENCIESDQFDYLSCTSCSKNRVYSQISDGYGTCECPPNTSDFNEQECDSSNAQERFKTATTTTLVASAVSMSILCKQTKNILNLNQTFLGFLI